MLKNNLIIVGIDPGTTLGYAILDIYGNVLKVNSSKQLDLNSLVKEVVSYGECVVVSSDVRKTPGFVKNFSAKVGARLITPNEDLRIDDKREMIQNFRVQDSHQRDALASAYNAYKRIKPLLKKIDNYLMKEGKENMEYEVKKTLIKKLSGNISELAKGEKIRIINNKKKRVKAKFLDHGKISQTDLLMKNENELLKNKIKFLERKIFKRNNEINNIVAKKVKNIAENREKEIFLLRQELSKSREEIKVLDEKIGILKEIISNGNYVAVNKVKNLGKDIDVHEDLLFVEEPNIFSEITIKKINEKINTIIYKNKPAKEIIDRLECSFIDSKSLDILGFDDIVLINKDKLNQEKNKKDILGKVLEEYKNKRSLF